MNKRNTNIMKVVIASFFCLLLMNPILGQVNMTKVKDASVSGSARTPVPGAVMELESVTKGFLTPRMTTGQRDAIPAANRTDGLLIFNTTSGCFNYWSADQDDWLSICGTPPPAVFDITDCSNVEANGVYSQGETLDASNFLTVPVTVTQAGTYNFSATTDNGYYFNLEGSFPSAGNYVLNVPGTGTPSRAIPPGDALSISLNGQDNTCSITILIAPADVLYSLACAAPAPVVEGGYFRGIPLDNTNTITLQVDVTNVGFWSVSSTTVNGYSFSGSGTFTNSGIQDIVLLGTGTPESSGVNSFDIVSNSSDGASCTGIQVTVESVAYTIDCASATPEGVYTEDVATTSANTISLPINVTATGETEITTDSVDGLSFSSGPITLSALGAQTVTLNATGTPTSDGTKTFTVSGTPGGDATCTVDVTVAPQPVAFSLNCGSITEAGDYAPGIAMTASNTLTVGVNVTYVGDYTISTNTVNGVSFSGTGTFATTGAQNVILTATGTPTDGGTFDYTLTSNSASGTTMCATDVLFIYRQMNVLGLGGGIYQPASSGTGNTSRALLASSANFSATGTIPVEGFNIINGNNNQGNTLRDLINNNNIDIVVIGFDYRPNADSRTILNDFVQNKLGVLIHSQENDTGSHESLITLICGGNVTVSEANSTSVMNVSNLPGQPILNGPFGDTAGLATGGDLNNSSYFENLPSTVTSLASNGNDSSRSWMFVHNTLGYMSIGDSGWTAGDATNSSNNIWPARISSIGVPQPKPGYGSGVTVYNSLIYANAMAWAIEYAQANTDVNYVIP
ncbi:hypothetical protein [Galbibacter mesophilus]|uniref:hypothetical protein n=1 Tax=Galbibacter mesophilus TaxID=379069 RepID=UPI00191DFF85|nr:hypothetical protein [Galbibacter mesophilus]MCM5663859.1 hypothetical protein [Galbibacter mesophilus]